MEDKRQKFIDAAWDLINNMENIGVNLGNYEGDHGRRMVAQHKALMDSFDTYIGNAFDEIERLRAALDFHPRAAKLMNKRKSFIVVADDEPYFHEVYSLIREHEIQKGTWTNEDQQIYEDATNALKGGG